MTSFPFTLLESTQWKDYELLDSGDGLKLERFGSYIFSRPESQAMWSRALPESTWKNVHANFVPSGEESGGATVTFAATPAGAVANVTATITGTAPVKLFTRQEVSQVP